MVTSAPANSQSQHYGQAQSHQDEGPVGKYYEVTWQTAQKNNPITRREHLLGNYYGFKCVLLKMYVGVLSPSTSECTLIGTGTLHRGNQVKMRSLANVLIQYNWCSYFKKWGHRDTGTG